MNFVWKEAGVEDGIGEISETNSVLFNNLLASD
jgi:hypothetical protein